MNIHKPMNKQWTVLRAVGFALALLLIVGLVLGRSVVRRLSSAAKSHMLAVLDAPQVTASRQGRYTDIIFLHHSVGTNLIEQGGVRERLTEAGYTFWDHGYNGDGLRGPDGSNRGYNLFVPDDNTDPDGLSMIFGQEPYPLPLNTLSALLQHDVIVIKSCFPNSQISSDGQLGQLKQLYLDMRNTMDKHPDKLFIVITQPPLNPAETNAENAARAHALATWLASDEFLHGQSNVTTFNLFDQLADGDPASPDYNMLRREYQDGADSHPNRLANETIGPAFADFIIAAADARR